MGMSFIQSNMRSNRQGVQSLVVHRIKDKTTTQLTEITMHKFPGDLAEQIKMAEEILPSGHIGFVQLVIETETLCVMLSSFIKWGHSLKLLVKLSS